MKLASFFGSPTKRASRRRPGFLWTGPDHDPFSKKFENHAHMVALYTVWYNFVKQHKSLKGITPAMAAGVSDKLWDMKDVAALVDAAAPKPGRRGSYKKKNTY